MRAIVWQALALVCGCILGFGLGPGPSDPSVVPAVSGPAAVHIRIGVSVPKARARTPAVHRKRREAKRKAAEERAKKAEEKRLRGKRVKELPIGCPYDTDASRRAGADIYSCSGLQYWPIKEKNFQGYEAHPVNRNPQVIMKSLERRRAAEKKREAAKRKKREANRIDQLPPSCTYDANASVGQPTDIYSCGGVLYRQYQEKGKTGYEVVPPPGQANQTAPAAPGGGGATY